jgi:3-methyladenine DNA glycosylase/8-oxoguanine DNA glycosylase
MSGAAVSARPARSYRAAAAILSERDPVLRRLVAQAGPVRVSPPTESHFAALVRAILYQQLAGAAARAIHGRLLAALGGEVTPKRLLSLSSQTLRAVGLSASKAASMQRLLPGPCRPRRGAVRLRIPTARFQMQTQVMRGYRQRTSAPS